MKKSEYITLRGLMLSLSRVQIINGIHVLRLAEDEAAMLERFLPKDTSYTFKLRFSDGEMEYTRPCQPVILYDGRSYKFEFFCDSFDCIKMYVHFIMSTYYTFVKLPEPPKNSFVESTRRRRATNEQNQGAD